MPSMIQVNKPDKLMDASVGLHVTKVLASPFVKKTHKYVLVVKLINLPCLGGNHIEVRKSKRR